MPKVKYFDGVKAAKAAAATSSTVPLEPFDFALLGATTRLAALRSSLSLRLLNPLYALSRRFKPVMPLAGFTHVTGAAQVREVLLRSADFIVPFGPEMEELGDGTTFMLGLDGAEHSRLRGILARAMDPGDADAFTRMSADFTRALLANSAGQIDVVGDLFKRVPSEICLRWFGFSCENVDAFGDWTLAVSALLFGDPYGNPEVRKAGLNGARRLLIVIDEAVRRARRHMQAGYLKAGDGETLVERLVLLQTETGLTDRELRAMLLGMVSGFVPTNTLAASRMLAVLLARPEAMAMARSAAERCDAEAMRRIVLEAGRLSPALSPGQWRFCPKDTTLDVSGRAVPITAGTTLLASTMSAMRDGRAVAQPGRFWPERAGADGQWQEPDMVFGYGPHDCIGKQLALSQITALFMALLSQKDIACARGKAGRMQWVGAFPRHLEMTFATPDSRQSMFLVIAPVTSGATKAAIDAAIGNLGHPAEPKIRQALDRTGLVRFASMSTIESEHRLDLVLELTVDGTMPAALDAIAREAEAWLRPAFSFCGLSPATDLRAFLADHIVKLHGKFWGATGLDYNGTGEFPIAAIERQNKFARFAERVLSDFLGNEAGRGSHPMRALDHLRRILAQDSTLARCGTAQQRELMREAAEAKFDAFAMKPSHARLKLTGFRPVSRWGAFGRFLKSRDGALLWGPVLLTAILFGLWFRSLLVPSASLIWDVTVIGLQTLLATAAVAAAVPFAFFAAIRRAEKRDWIDNSQASLEHVAAIGDVDDEPGYAQNHVMAVGTLKRGWLRVFANAFALWAVRVVITYFFRPGFVINMGTIHAARWWRLPGSNRMVFFSNFDGSWESYLEDFITRAHPGQSATWSNWEGFPPTRFLIHDGARDGDRFKRWERTVQRAAPFWYTRFPAMTTDQIRNNALIHSGVARAQSQDDAEEWLRCFGSMPRIENRIESDEVQALVFTGLGRLKFSASLAIELPPQGAALGEWLSWIRGEILASDGRSDALDIAGLVDQGVLVQNLGADGTTTGYSLAHSLTVAFGDRPIVGDKLDSGQAPETLDTSDLARRPQAARRLDAIRMRRRALFFACSAAGMAKFPAPNSGHADLSETFPPTFRLGMASRGRILGDIGNADSANWRWGDDPNKASAAEAALLVYAESPEDLAYLVQVHSALLDNHGGRIIQQTDCAPARIDRSEDQHDFEHFGYRDGISQPVIRGTARYSQAVPERDVVEPGEFIIGYVNGQGYFPGSSLLPAEADVARSLPQLSVADLGRYPDFDRARSGEAMRDFGRNGSFVVIRELAQDVDSFEAFVESKAQELRGDALSADGRLEGYRDLYKLIGQYPDKDWVKAKLMGRWPNGRPLVGNPVNMPSPGPDNPAAAACRAAERENDFTYGRDDPQGLACPFGAHIRRTNPRDSKHPGDIAEQAITNRHRLLRRGRTYTRIDEKGAQEKGLLFVSLCSDLARQFEFVQQLWSNSPGFHGLTHEPDPIFGSDVPDPTTNCPMERSFTIPTAAGPIRLTGMESFVEVKAGGYFFLPSRSALAYLTEISLRAGEVEQ